MSTRSSVTMEMQSLMLYILHFTYQPRPENLRYQIMQIKLGYILQRKSEEAWLKN
jgi:hypothetical protein